MDMLWVTLVVLALLPVWKVFQKLAWRPYALTRWFEKQGITGPRYFFISGSFEEIKDLKKVASEKVLDTHTQDIIPKILPHYCKWLSLHGETFLYWFGTQPRICITEPELAKEVLSIKFGFYPKSKARPPLAATLGKGLVFVNGLDWVRHRRIVSPAFNVDKIKVMTKRMAACILSVLDGWQEQAIQTEEKYKEMDISEEFLQLTADILTQTAFGSSYMEGKEVFEVQKELIQRAAASLHDVFFPGCQYIPTSWNVQTWKLKRRARNTLKRIIEKKLNSDDGRHSEYSSYGDDLLGFLLGIPMAKSSRKQGGQLDMDEIIDECKTFFFGGHDTVSHLLSWTTLLLSLHNEWQEKLREEVLRECGMEIPDADKLSKLKLVNMVLLETLRLYPPVAIMTRMASRDMKLGDISIPKDIEISIPVPMIHRNKKYWGEDADEFKPMRFVDGIARAAKHPNALLAFSTGPRVCIGQTFAMIETKMVIAMILQRFTFTLSPQYKHSPIIKITLQPQFGLPVILQPLHG
ncbi:cytochrome P450 709B1-like isoform X3 [Magnolia sinica]|uniref:cytochrome P450 709B1-like isoform X3 n=1 Tax=Magnolia sinica TaxID=86752 RepID=UPI002657F188|nr:cytochrome P450 709B1-like isoform X3 [Magnolia sinica]